MNNKLIAGLIITAAGLGFGYLLKRSNDELNEAVVVYRKSLDKLYSVVTAHPDYDPHSLTGSIELMLKLSDVTVWGSELSKYQVKLIRTRERTLVTEYILSKYDFEEFHKTA